MESCSVDREDCRVEPIREGQNSKVNIIIICCRAMNDDRPNQAVSILD